MNTTAAKTPTNTTPQLAWPSAGTVGRQSDQPGHRDVEGAGVNSRPNVCVPAVDAM